MAAFNNDWEHWAKVVPVTRSRQLFQFKSTCERRANKFHSNEPEECKMYLNAAQQAPVIADEKLSHV